jgi:hypothetical protein
MPLLLDGQPFKLDDLAVKEYSRNFTYMIPKSKVSQNRVNGRLEIGSGVGIPPEYRFIDSKSGKECTLRYFEVARWDDTQRKDSFFPEQVMIGETGKLIVGETQAELNFFLNLHPGLEGGVMRAKYPRYPVIFRLKNKSKDATKQLEEWKIKKEMEEYIHPESSKAWKFDRLVAACEALANDNEFASIPVDLRLPEEVLNYREIELMPREERDAFETVLRVALINVIDKWPRYAHDRLMKSRDRVMLALINRASQTEFTNFKFDVASSTWVEMVKDKWTPILKVKQSANPKNALVKEMANDPKFYAQIEAIANRTGS